MLGLTRENLSQNALGIGVGLGCIVGGWTVPTLLAPADDALLAEAATSKPVGGMEAATLQGMDTNVTAVIASVSTRGSLSQYLLTLRTLSSVSRFDQWSFLLTTVLLLLLGRLLWQWFARPFEYVRGYEKDKRLEAAYLRLAGAIPPGYPNTWYKICDSFDVPSSLSSSSSSCSGSFRIDCLGESLLCFRAPKEHPWKDEGVKEGEVVVLVEASLSGLDPRAQLFECGPSNRKVKRWISQEINRMVFAWHHDANHSDASTSPDPSDATPSIVQPPQWDIPLIKGMDESWNYHGRVTHEIACHIQEIPENGADVAHLEYIHGDFLLSWLRLIRHTWTATWDPSSEPQGHIAKLILNQRVTICGIPVPGTSLDSNIDQVGPALVQLIFPTPFGKVAVIETITPICHTLQRAQNVLYAEKTVPRFLSKVFLMGLVVQFERDLPIWNYKHFLRKPLILKEDGPILKYRRWMRQFYSDPQYQNELREQGEKLMQFANA